MFGAVEVRFCFTLSLVKNSESKEPMTVHRWLERRQIIGNMTVQTRLQRSKSIHYQSRGLRIAMAVT